MACFQATMSLSPGTRLALSDGGTALHLAQRCPAPPKWHGNATVWRFARRTPGSRATSWATLLLVVFLSGCSGGVAPEPSVSGSPPEASFDATDALAEVLTFHASFDDGIDADWALGDRQIYTAPSYAEQDLSLIHI